MQTRLYRLRNWIQRKRKLILILAVSALIIVSVGQSGFYVQNRDLYNKAEKLLANPAPLPDFIVSIRLGEARGDYWPNKEICIGICWRDAEHLGTPDIALYMDDMDDDDFPFVSSGIYATWPADLCWAGNFYGLHVARVEVKFATAGTLSYEWAFQSGPGGIGDFKMYNPPNGGEPYCLQDNHASP